MIRVTREILPGVPEKKKGLSSRQALFYFDCT